MAGGALPCPEALAILLVAVSLGRIGLGLGLIVSFSAGLAAVLIALGVLLVRAEGRLQRWTRAGTAWQRWVPLGSAAIVMTLGLAMLANVYRTAALPPTAVLAGSQCSPSSRAGIASRCWSTGSACRLVPDRLLQTQSGRRPLRGCHRATTAIAR